MRFRPLLCALCVPVVRLSLDICLPEQPRAPPFGVPPIDVTNYVMYRIFSNLIRTSFCRFLKRKKKN